MGVNAMRWGSVQQPKVLERLCNEISPLIGTEIEYLKIPIEAAKSFEPSQIGTIVGTLTDAVLPYIALAKKVGLTKGPGILGDREGYPDFFHTAGYRLELKGLFCDNESVVLKKPPTRREPSARLTQKVTVKNVQPDTDLLLVLSYQLQVARGSKDMLTPVIKDIGLFPAIECVKARDHRLKEAGGIWFGDYQTPAILSKKGKAKAESMQGLDKTVYGRKEQEGRDYNEDTNFGKLKRIPYMPLQMFLAKNNASFSSKGNYPKEWKITDYAGGSDESE